LILTIREAQKRHRPSFLDLDFTAQTRFLNDTSPLKVGLCTRRAGKSFGMGLGLLRAAYYTPGCNCLYVALTRDSAKKIMWKDVLKVIDKEEGLNCKFHENDLTCTLPDPINSVIYLLGADSSEKEKAKMLGQKYRRIVIDEASQYSINLEELVYGTLKPSVADYRGDIYLIGTPSDIHKGLYYELTQGQDPTTPHTWKAKGWSGHAWSAFHNPYMAEKWQAEIDDLKLANPLIDETPLFQQNYYGRWCINESALVYRFNRERNLWSGALPKYDKGDWHFILGVDLGYNDPSAFSLCAYHDNDPCLYVVYCEAKAKMDITEVAERIRIYQYRVQHEFKQTIEAMVVDGSNKQAVEEMRRRHDLPVQATMKTGKSDFIELMNGDFIMGKIKVHETQAYDLTVEYGSLIWNEHSIKREEHPACPNHCTDATLYAWRKCYQYLSTKPQSAPKPGTKEWFDAEAAEMEAMELARLEEEKVMERDWSW